MKPVYDECCCKWRVKGFGLFDNPQDAWRVIKDNEKNKVLTLLISNKMRSQLNQIANDRNISVSELVRQAIEREVNDYGKEK